MDNKVKNSNREVSWVPGIRMICIILSYSLLVACGGGGSSSETIALLANAGADQTRQEGNTVVLDGSASTSQNNILTYQWNQLSGTSVDLSDATVAMPEFTAPELLGDEVLVFELVVNDGENSSPPSTVNINIVADNDVPLADAGPAQSVNEADVATLNATSSSDPESQSLTYAWTQVSGTPVILSSDTSDQPQFTAHRVMLDETLEFQLVVNDGVNDSSASTVQVTITNVPHDVVIAKELMITDLSVVESTHAAAGGKWTFEHLITQMMPQENPTAQQKSDFVLNWLAHWASIQSVNGFSVPARPALQGSVIDPWLLASGGSGVLDLSIAPFRLLSIVNRIDLAKRNELGDVLDAGEGRFVFGVLDPAGNPTQFTLIFEYGLPATNEQQLNSWIDDWHNLSLHEFSNVDPAYNNALIALTDRFTSKNANPLKPNGSAINQVRTNEVLLSFPWELREFNLSVATGQLVQVTVKDNPDLSIANSTLVRDLINTNETAILDGTFSVPETFNAQPMLAGSSINSLGLASVLNPAGVNNSEARHKLSLNTCMGCHGAETNTSFLHVHPRSVGFESQLSGFLKGDINGQPVNVTDPVNPGTTRQFFDLGTRKTNLECLIVRCDIPL